MNTETQSTDTIDYFANQDAEHKATQALRLAAAKATVSAYFKQLNASEFAAAAARFQPNGQLLPPFESAIVGREAIAAYLKAEAKGMQAVPESVETELLSAGEVQIQVIGQVEAALFTVNVGWRFRVNSSAEIACVKIKLLASLKDLLHLQR